MGSSGKALNKGIDASAGGLIWVRRRNGSWWPGRILGPDELPKKCLASPKLGTPVKLLGREDASVDWYNLEKSKRVKAFRCGEYDACIEKAKASTISPKKAVKYARREDAILQALELESAHLAEGLPGICSGLNNQGGEEHVFTQSPVSCNHCEDSENMDKRLSDSLNDSDLVHDLSQTGVPFEVTNHISASKEQSMQDGPLRTPNDSEEDGEEGTIRMRGLDDLGMVVVSTLKRKRSQVAHVHEFLKKKSRRRPLAKVLECTEMVLDSTALVSVPVMFEQLPSPTGSSLLGCSDSKVSGIESNESKKVQSAKESEISSKIGLLESHCTEMLFDVPFVAEEIHSAGQSPIVSWAPQKAKVSAGAQSSQSSQVETVSTGNEEYNESGSTSSGTAKWQLKGMRNSRQSNTSMRQDSGKSMDVDDESSPYFTNVDRDEFRGWSRNLLNEEPQTKSPTTEVRTNQRVLPYRQSRFTVNPKYESSEFFLRHHFSGSCLYDVNLEVKTSCRPQHVPYVSLMSKLHGQPVTGHPLTVEVVEDGFCNHLLFGGSKCYSSSYELDDNPGAGIPAAPGVCKSKTSSGGGFWPKHRVPRPSPSKSPKLKKSGLLSKKMRKLSSLTGAQKQSGKEKKPVVLKGPSVACVPLKVVFSRIYAALNSAVRPSHRLTELNRA